jgi:hypothetical protein
LSRQRFWPVPGSSRARSKNLNRVPNRVQCIRKKLWEDTVEPTARPDADCLGELTAGPALARRRRSLLRLLPLASIGKLEAHGDGTARVLHSWFGLGYSTRFTLFNRALFDAGKAAVAARSLPHLRLYICQLFERLVRRLCHNQSLSRDGRTQRPPGLGLGTVWPLMRARDGDTDHAESQHGAAIKVAKLRPRAKRPAILLR